MYGIYVTSEDYDATTAICSLIYLTCTTIYIYIEYDVLINTHDALESRVTAKTIIRKNLQPAQL